jgi:hypothetical protein
MVRIGNYEEKWEMWVGETGEEVILGLPFLESVIVTKLDWKEQTFAFTNSRDMKKHNWKRSLEELTLRFYLGFIRFYVST